MRMNHDALITVVFDSDDSIEKNFRDKYCRKMKDGVGYALHDSFLDEKFLFCVNYAGFGRFLDSFLEKYSRKIEMHFKFSVPCNIQFRINCDLDYNSFFKNYIDVYEDTEENGAFKLKIKDDFTNCCFSFKTEYKNGEKINELLLHDYLLIVSHLKPFRPIRFDVIKQYSKKSEEIEDQIRYSTYLQTCKQEILDSIFLNGCSIKKETLQIGKLFPAMYLDRDFLDFVRAPVSSDLWERIIKTDRNTLLQENKSENTADSKERKYWYLLQVCSKYLFDDFRDNNSTAYTELRKKMFSDRSFYEHISSMPFLTVLLFAQYDYFWRSDIFRDYKALLKSKYESVPLPDLIATLQPMQEKSHYKAYRQQMNEEVQSDIKSLIKNLGQLNPYALQKICNELQEQVEKHNPHPALYKIKISLPCRSLTELIDCSIYRDGKNICKTKTERTPLDEEEINIIKTFVDQFIKERIGFPEMNVHRIVVHELFEAQTISEGLLQMIENAVYHSGNGLLSIRIRDYNGKKREDETDNTYLKEKFETY